MKPASRSAVEPFRVMEVMKAAAERELAGGDVLHLEVGQPSTGAPAGVVDAATQALRSDRLGYTDATGTPGLRQRIADHYREWYRIEIDPARIAVTLGASGACVLTFLSCFDPGDRVGVLEPGYPCYRNMLAAFGCDVVGIPVGAETDFRVTPALVDEVGHLDGLVVASPSNPTGTMLSRVQLAALVEQAAGSGTRLVVDEIYHGISYGDSPPSVLELTDDAVVINSFSKYFSMTGWRLGWMVTDTELVRPVERLAQNLFVAPPTHSQLAAEAAFDCAEELDANVARYARNRHVLLEQLPSAGLDKLAPADGAFYIYADVTDLLDEAIEDSQALCAVWLAELSIAATPGVDFDPVRGDRFVRFSFAGTTDDMAEAAARLNEWHRTRR